MNGVSLLEEIGFRRVGSWKIGSKGLDFAIEAEVRSSRRSLYAFVVGTEVLYVGKAVGRFAGRMIGYRNPGKTQHTNSRINPEILRSKEEVIIYHFQSDEKIEFKGLLLNISTALEEALIERISPIWNITGKRKKTEPNQSPEPMHVAVTPAASHPSRHPHASAHL